MDSAKTKWGFPTPTRSQPQLSLAVGCGAVALYEKICLFCEFFYGQPCSQNTKMAANIFFVDIEGFRPYLSKPSYRAPNWALMVCLMQKERLKSPQKSLIIENQAVLVILVVILAILAQTAIFGHFGQPFPNQGGRAETKFQSGSCLHQRDQAAFGFSGVYTHRKPGKKIYCRGCGDGIM